MLLWGLLIPLEGSSQGRVPVSRSPRYSHCREAPRAGCLSPGPRGIPTAGKLLGEGPCLPIIEVFPLQGNSWGRVPISPSSRYSHCRETPGGGSPSPHHQGIPTAGKLLGEGPCLPIIEVFPLQGSSQGSIPVSPSSSYSHCLAHSRRIVSSLKKKNCFKLRNTVFLIIRII